MMSRVHLFTVIHDRRIRGSFRSKNSWREADMTVADAHKVRSRATPPLSWGKKRTAGNCGAPRRVEAFQSAEGQDIRAARRRHVGPAQHRSAGLVETVHACAARSAGDRSPPGSAVYVGTCRLRCCSSSARHRGCGEKEGKKALSCSQGVYLPKLLWVE